MRLKKPKPIWFLATGSSVAALILGLFLAREEMRHPGYLEDLPLRPIFAIQEYRARVPFSEIQWKNPASVPDVQMNPGRLTVRVRMVDALLNQNSFSGWTRKQIEDLLGPGTITEYFNDWDLVYYLGSGRYGNAVGDSEWLVFRLDPSGRVREYKIVHD